MSYNLSMFGFLCLKNKGKRPWMSYGIAEGVSLKWSLAHVSNTWHSCYYRYWWFLSSTSLSPNFFSIASKWSHKSEGEKKNWQNAWYTVESYDRSLPWAGNKNCLLSFLLLTSHNEITAVNKDSVLSVRCHRECVHVLSSFSAPSSPLKWEALLTPFYLGRNSLEI